MKVLASLEKCWAAADQDPFIAAIILNPFLHRKCFSHTNAVLSPIDLCNMLKHLHLHIFISEVDSQFLSTFMDYYNGHAEYSNAFLSLQMWEDIARAQVSPRVIYHYSTTVTMIQTQPLESWHEPCWCMGGHWYAGTSGLQLPCKVGCACSQHCCKLSRCEQAFSHMGLIQTATQN